MTPDDPKPEGTSETKAQAPIAEGGAPPPERTPGMFESMLGEVPLELSVELGRVTLSLREVAGRLGPGSVIALTKLTGDKLDIRVNDRLVARGEAVAIGERYGVRIVEIVGVPGGKIS